MPKLRTRHNSDLDNPKRWSRYMKTWFDVESFQERINQRAGLNHNGQPVVKLVWGQDVRIRAFGEETPRYWTKRQRVEGQFIWYTVPRWMFETRLEPEQYHDAWQQTRYSIHESDGSVIDKGPPPDEYFTYMMDASVHEGLTQNGRPACCNRAWYIDRTRCWGTYRQPNDFDLQVISQTTREMEASKRNPYRALTAVELREIEVNANMQMDRADEELARYEAEMSRDFDKRFAHLLRGEGARPIIDLGGIKTEGGIVLPFTKGQP